MKDRAKKRKKNTFSTLLSILFLIVVSVAVFGYIVPACSNVKAIGEGIGKQKGDLVGGVIGSYKGITEGLENGYNSGKTEGLSAKDTTADVKSRFVEVGNLEVLEAGVKLKNVNKLGDDYAALHISKGVAIYTVDLKQAKIRDIDKNNLEIMLPGMDVEIYIDENETEKLAEYQKNPWKGNSQDGFEEYMNSRTEIDKSVKDAMENYDVLTENAKESARKQVSLIATAATGNKKNINVLFEEVEDGE